MRFTAAPSVPTGDFLAHVGDWTGLPPAELLGLLRGAAPVSAGASDELDAADAPRSRPTRRRRRCSTSDGDPDGVLAALRARDGEVGRGGAGVPRPGRLPAARRLRHLRPLRARAARRAAARDPRRARRRRRRERGDVEDRDRRGPRARCPRSTGRSSTSCSRRRGSPTRSATSAASSATSGRPGSCAGRCWPPAAGSPPRGRRPRPRAPRRRRLRRDVRAGRGRRTGRRRTSWRSAHAHAHLAAPPRTRPPSLGRPAHAPAGPVRAAARGAAA